MVLGGTQGREVVFASQLDRRPGVVRVLGPAVEHRGSVVLPAVYDVLTGLGPLAGATECDNLIHYAAIACLARVMFGSSSDNPREGRCKRVC